MKHGTRRAYVGLGSNQDRPRLQLRRAMHALQRLPATRVLGRSCVYRSPAVGPGVQPAYLNAVVALETRLPAPRLLARLHGIEALQGRRRDGRRWTPRTLDLDLLLYDDLQCRTPMLSVPHPEMVKRSFVLYPLAEIDPEMRLPDGRKLAELAKALPRAHLSRIRY